MSDLSLPTNVNSCLILADGSVFFGEAIGYQKNDSETTIGEICFNTGMVGYQETLTDPSYAGQIITFTFPHIGNVGCNTEDLEATKTYASGLIIRERITEPSNFRSESNLNAWLIANKISGICGVDTRAITRHIRTAGSQNAMIVSSELWQKNSEKLLEQLRNYPSMNGLDLAKTVTTTKPYEWTQGEWKMDKTLHTAKEPLHNIVAIDYGEKLNILRCLAERGCKVTVVPASMSAEDILAYNPNGIFLSNGPGDPAATGVYAVPILQKLIASGVPIFGICLGHQILSIALGGKTEKMPQGHRGANHPVKNMETGAVEITSQNHGFAVLAESLPSNVKVSHISLFDGSVEGLQVEGKSIFSVQYHPESSPGPHDSTYLFDKFIANMAKK